MKLNLLLGFFLLFFLSACTKEPVVPNVDAKAEALAHKYHLVLEKKKSSYNNFDTLDELDKYLEQKDSLEKKNLLVKENKKLIESSNTSNLISTNETYIAYETSIPSDACNFTSENYHEYTLYFPGMQSHGFPYIGILV